MKKGLLLLCKFVITLSVCGILSGGSSALFVKAMQPKASEEGNATGDKSEEGVENAELLSDYVEDSAGSIDPPNDSDEVVDIESSAYPHYYYRMVDEYIDKVNAEFEAIGDHGFAFCFVTDQHIEYNAGYTPCIIRYIYNATPLKYVINGGDFFDRDKTKEGGIDKLEGCISEFDFLEVPIFTTLGNHDLSESYNASHPEAYLTMEEFYEHAMSQMEKVTYYDRDNGKYHYYYYDEDTDTYLICLQTGGSIVDSASASFLKADALVLQDLLPTLDGNIIIFTHQLNKVNSEYSHNNSWNRLVKVIKASGSTDKVKLIVSGHTHEDLSDDSEGLLHVVTTTNSHKYLDEAVGTTDELAFDTYFVDYENGTVKVLRFGRGEDRSFDIPD